MRRTAQCGSKMSLLEHAASMIGCWEKLLWNDTGIAESGTYEYGEFYTAGLCDTGMVARCSTVLLVSVWVVCPERSHMGLGQVRW